jgi:hypothetical protein
MPACNRLVHQAAAFDALVDAVAEQRALEAAAHDRREMDLPDDARGVVDEPHPVAIGLAGRRTAAGPCRAARPAARSV